VNHLNIVAGRRVAELIMWRVCFGNEPGWVPDIATSIDPKNFKCRYGDLNLAEFGDFDCIVPLNLSDYDVLQNRRSLLGQKFWFPERDVVDLCDDKLALNKWLLGGQFAHLVPALLNPNCGLFPYILKKRRDGWGENSFIVRNSDDERTMATKFQSPEYFCQSYIPGTEEFALHLLLVNQEIIYAQTVKYEFVESVYVKGRRLRPMRYTCLPYNEYIDIFSKLLIELGYTGTCCVNYKLDNGSVKLLEINPRFGASLAHLINSYLVAYLSSLGLLNKSDFCYALPISAAANTAADNSIRLMFKGSKKWLRDRTPNSVLQLSRILRAKYGLGRHPITPL
jgi:hypothetical protein